MSPPKTALALSGVVAALSLSGCGGAPRDEVADMYVAVASETGFDVDVACVERVLGAMSDDDVNKLADAGLDGNADLTEQGYRVLLTDVPSQCVDVDQYTDYLIEGLAVDGTVDLDCVRSGLADATSTDEVDRLLDSVIASCPAGGV